MPAGERDQRGWRSSISSIDAIGAEDEREHEHRDGEADQLADRSAGSLLGLVDDRGRGG